MTVKKAGKPAFFIFKGLQRGPPDLHLAASFAKGTVFFT
jgi:hypothetical protein